MDTQYSGMLSEDKSAIANMPQSVVYKAYPKQSYITSEIDDTMGQLDSDRKSDLSNISKNKSRVKY